MYKKKYRLYTVFIIPRSVIWMLYSVYFQTRSSADADRPHDVFRGQSRPPNMVPFDTLGMVSY